MKVNGIPRMTATIRQVAQDFPDRVKSALYMEAQIEATKMKRRTPVDTTDNAPHPGNLRNSIHVEDPVRNFRNISVTIATGAQAPYAVYVHENPDAIHPVGQWKFMESVLDESMPYMAARVGHRLHLGDR